jgi:hypothetical protein
MFFGVSMYEVDLIKTQQSSKYKFRKCTSESVVETDETPQPVDDWLDDTASVTSAATDASKSNGCKAVHFTDNDQVILDLLLDIPFVKDEITQVVRGLTTNFGEVNLYTFS